MIKGPTQPTVGEATPRLVVLGSTRKQAEQAMGSKAVLSNTPHGLCFSSCLQVPALTTFDDELSYETVSEKNPFPSQATSWSWWCTTAIVTLTKSVPSKFQWDSI